MEAPVTLTGFASGLLLVLLLGRLGSTGSLAQGEGGKAVFECLLLTPSPALVERRLFRWASFLSPLPVSRNIPGGPPA